MMYIWVCANLNHMIQIPRVDSISPPKTDFASVLCIYRISCGLISIKRCCEI